MIDILTENVITLSDATKLLPKRRRDKQPYPGTLKNWAKFGLKNVFLETIVVGNTTCTSVEALQRFLEALTAASGQNVRPTNTFGPGKAQAQVERELDERGTKLVRVKLKETPASRSIRLGLQIPHRCAHPNFGI